jgi:hypothetical protein
MRSDRAGRKKAALLSMTGDMSYGSGWGRVIRVLADESVDGADKPAETAAGQAGRSRWGGYYARGRERGPRPLLLRACEVLAAGRAMAVDRDEAGLSLLRNRVRSTGTCLT